MPKIESKTAPAPAELSVIQLNAVDLLAAGESDAETAATLNIHRITVCRWRNHLPEFKAALARQRRAVWGSALDKLRMLLPRAVDVLAAELDSGEDRAEVALNVLKLAGAAIAVVPNDPTTPEEYVREAIAAERKARLGDREGELDDLIASSFGSETPAEAVRGRLAALAADDSACPTSGHDEQ